MGKAAGGACHLHGLISPFAIMTGKGSDDALGHLMDHRRFTGMHRHRFDRNGKGKGLKGRDSIIKGLGTMHDPYLGGPIWDIAQVVRNFLRLPRADRSSRYGVKSDAETAPSARPNDPQTTSSPIWTKLTNPKLYTGTHIYKYCSETIDEDVLQEMQKLQAMQAYGAEKRLPGIWYDTETRGRQQKASVDRQDNLEFLKTRAIKLHRR
ncbi:unnamed protein product (mitochondrion) [Plasmodiophora brassicae]|uniref:Uncharacterized protein n=2 Tax=Plasmodiophora brassicae TaxID=37360 RepID=A0A3P3Y4Q1_PLABS|nr:unnamed protein product [Plasmodiophora brassicae]